MKYARKRSFCVMYRSPANF